MKNKGISEIARLADVSMGTVSRALLGGKGVSQPTRERILAIAEGVGYKANLAARALYNTRTPIRVRVCIPCELHYYFDDLRTGALDEAGRVEHLGIDLELRVTGHPGFIEEAGRVSKLIADGVRALIIAPGDPGELCPVINEAESNGVCCVRCGYLSVSKLEKRQQYECNGCGYQLSVAAGTLFHDSHLPLWKWFLACYLIVESKKNVSANQFKWALGLSYKTAWYLCPGPERPRKPKRQKSSRGSLRPIKLLLAGAMTSAESEPHTRSLVLSG